MKEKPKGKHEALHRRSRTDCERYDERKQRRDKRETLMNVERWKFNVIDSRR